MNKFIIFLVLFTTTFLKAQETASNFSEISTNVSTQVSTYLSVKNSSGAGAWIGEDGRSCTYGGKISHNTGFVNNTLQIYQHQNLMSSVTNIIVYKKVLKP